MTADPQLVAAGYLVLGAVCMLILILVGRTVVELFTNRYADDVLKCECCALPFWACKRRAR